MATSVSQTAPTGWVGYWRFDQVGNVALDRSENRNNGNIVGSNNRNDQVEGQAFIVLTRRKTKAEIPATKTLDLVEAITMEAWIQPKSLYIGNDWKQCPSILAKVRPITKKEIYPAAFTVFNHKNGLVEKSTCRNLLANKSM